VKRAQLILTALVLLTVATSGLIVPPPARAGTTRPAAGTVVAWESLPHPLWIPGTTARAFRLTYVTTDPFGKPAYSTGTVFLPRGGAPRGGWPVVSWAHGTSGLGDACAPSRVGPAEKVRDWTYLATWMRQGYSIVASDYVGLGTPGLMPYLDGMTTANNVVDIVKAGRAFAAAHRPPSDRLSSSWVTIGQSQGAGASIYTARYANTLGGAGLHYKGAVGTGTPGYVEVYLTAIGPKSPPVALPSSTTAYLSYIFAALRYVHPELGIDGILTPTGRRYLAMAETVCVQAFAAKLQGVSIGDFFTAFVETLPNFKATVRAYMSMPESGFDRPFFMGHGIIDTNVPIPATARYVAVLLANRQPVTFKAYPTDHSGTMAASLPDTVPFVRRLFASP
jgi:hypothetical protein